MEYLLVIAALCGSPSGKYPGPSSTSTHYYNSGLMLQCQKHYLNCVNNKIKKNSFIMRQTALEECILEKK